MKDKTTGEVATYSPENGNVRSVCQILKDEGDWIRVPTLGMFWEQRAHRTLRGVKNKQSNGFKTGQPSNLWTDRQRNGQTKDSSIPEWIGRQGSTNMKVCGRGGIESIVSR